MKITHHNPDTLHKNPAFSQAITVDPPARLVFIGGQNAVSADGQVVGDDVGAQTEQALKNLLLALDAVGAKQENVVKMAIYLVQGGDLQQGFAASQKVWGRHATTLTFMFVAGLANPKYLVEIEAIAAVPL